MGLEDVYDRIVISHQKLTISFSLVSGIYQYPAFISIRHLLVSGIYQYLAFQLYGIDLNHTLKHSISITFLQCIYHLFRPQREGVLFINTKYYMCNPKLLLHLSVSGIYQYPAFISIRHLLVSGIYQYPAFQLSSIDLNHTL